MDDVQDVESVHAARIGEGLGMSSEAILDAIRARGRDNARTPMQWDDMPHAGFTLGTPWLPVNPNYKQINAAAQVDDPDSVFAHYQALITLRHDLPVIAEGDFEMLVPDDETVYAFTRSLDGETLLVLANFSAAEQTFDLAEPDAQVVMSNYGDRASPVGALHPWEATIYRTAGAAP
jgi:oligo-1,6-glucosidase